jgi:hypothetical protein
MLSPEAASLLRLGFEHAEICRNFRQTKVWWQLSCQLFYEASHEIPSNRVRESQRVAHHFFHVFLHYTATDDTRDPFDPED